jgi:signal transduction histidine kinase
MLLALVVLLQILAVGPDVAEARARILIVFDEDNDLPGLAGINRSLRETFTTGLGGEVEFYSESLNLSQFPGPDHDGVLRDHFRRKYAGVPLDLIVAVMDPSVEFLLRHRAIFPRVPIVFCGADRFDLQGRTLGADLTGVVVKRDYAPTLEIALKLHPDTRNVFVVGGAARFDRRVQTIARRDFARFEPRVAITYLTGLPMGDLLAALSLLPPHSVIVYLSLFADSAGFTFLPHDALSQVAQAANAPVYVAVDQYIGRGAVGGHVYSFDTHGQHAAEIGLRILRGEPAASIPIAEPEAYTDLFDWRQLQRWGIDERQLPAGSVVRFRAPSVWNLYKWYITGGVLLLAVQSALIAGLLVNRTERRRAQRTLAERLRFETLLSQLSTELLTMPASSFDHAVERMLQRVVETLDFDRAALAERVDGTLRTRHTWTRPGIAPVPARLAAPADFPWLTSQVTGGEVVRISRLDDLPEAAATDRQSLAGRGIRALTALPLLADGALVGALAFSRLRGEYAWPDELTARLQLLADVFANVLARRHADEAVRTSEERRRQAEEEALRQRDELAHAQRVSTLGELTASIAHEISQPLSAILTNAQATLRSLATEEPKRAEIEEVFTDIAADTERASHTIRRLRALFRKQQAERIAVDIDATIEDILGLVRSEMVAKRIAVSYARGTDEGLVLGDPIQLRQVLLNLIVNAGEAIAAMEDGTREIRITTSQPDTGQVAVAIRDSGVGVPASELERIFEHFVSSKPQGLGLGLTISRSIVEAHGGRIWATRNEDRGLTLHVTLPIGPSGDPAGRQRLDWK